MPVAWIERRSTGTRYRRFLVWTLWEEKSVGRAGGILRGRDRRAMVLKLGPLFDIFIVDLGVFFDEFELLFVNLE